MGGVGQGTFVAVEQVRNAWQWGTSSRGVVVLMSLIMLCFTCTSLLDVNLQRLPGRPGLIVLSTIGAVVGLGVGFHGRRPTTVGWVGLTWMFYAATRALAWVSIGSWTGLVAWLPAFLLGMVVFARRKVDQEGGPDERRPA